MLFEMPGVVGIRFKSCGKIYDFESDGFDVRRGDRVVVESEFGLSIGTVVVGPAEIEPQARELKKVLRVAGEDDFRQKEANEEFEGEARNFCLERIMARGLPMKLVCSEVTLDRKRIVFFFTADGRIDFRELVKDLAAKFKTRIEMRQIGVRDKAKLVGGLGLCGKELCCRLFLTSFEPISIKMAKQQDLTLNTGKLSGICGRLMCCLGYEYSEEAGNRRREEKRVPEERKAPEVAAENSALPEAICSSAEPNPPQAVVEETPQKQEGRKKGRKRRRRYRKKVHKNE
ncbi:MAG: regulatory iron-sulfur-containing complex subunit RicT [Candidatus Sulfobium sp.]